jgi:hypothetical protein
MCPETAVEGFDDGIVGRFSGPPMAAASLSGSTSPTPIIPANPTSCGADSVDCSLSPRFIEPLAREGIPVCAHAGLVPQRARLTGMRAFGKTAAEARAAFAAFPRCRIASGTPGQGQDLCHTGS